MITSDKDVVFSVGFFDELGGDDFLLLFLLWSAIRHVVINILALTLQCVGRLLYLLLFLVILSFLQAHEIFTIDLVKFILDVVDDLCDTGDENELERVDTSVRHLERLIKGHELRLESRDCDQDSEELSELLSGTLDGLTTHRETKEIAVADLIDILQLEDGELHTGNII